MRTGYRRPNWNGPLDLEARLAAAPPDATVKGLVIQPVTELALKTGVPPPGRDRYLPFKDYPLREYLEVLAEGARRIAPSLPIRESLRRIGQNVFPQLLESLIGKVVYGSLGSGRQGGRDALQLVAKGYQVTTNHLTRADLLEHTDRHAVLHLTNVWSFPDCYHVAIFEGAFAHYRLPVEIGVRIDTISEVEFFLEWQDSPSSPDKPPNQ